MASPRIGTEPSQSDKDCKVYRPLDGSLVPRGSKQELLINKNCAACMTGALFRQGIFREGIRAPFFKLKHESLRGQWLRGRALLPNVAREPGNRTGVWSGWIRMAGLRLSYAASILFLFPQKSMGGKGGCIWRTTSSQTSCSIRLCRLDWRQLIEEWKS